MAQEWAEYLVDEICLSNSGFTLDGLRLGENITSRWSNGELEESGLLIRSLSRPLPSSLFK